MLNIAQQFLKGRNERRKVEKNDKLNKDILNTLII